MTIIQGPPKSLLWWTVKIIPGALAFITVILLIDYVVVVRPKNDATIHLNFHNYFDVRYHNDDEREMSMRQLLDTTTTKKKPKPIIITPPTSGYYSNTTLPDVLMTGVQKSGSTAVSEWLFGGFKNNRNRMCCGRVLKGDPSLCVKEPHYFDHYHDYNETKYLTYLSRFNDCVESNHMSMDATPNYFQEAELVYSTYEKLGEENHVKIIVTLREPVAREFSWYNHQLKNGGVMEEVTFEDFIVNRTMVSIRRKYNYGLYASHLQSWIKYFDRRNILILSYQEIRDDPGMVQWRIQQFLGLNDEELPVTGHFKKANALKNPLKKPLPYCTEAYYDLVNLYGPLNEELYQFLELYPGQEMEQHPFPQFSTIGCIPMNENEEEEEEEWKLIG